MTVPYTHRDGNLSEWQKAIADFINKGGEAGGPLDVRTSTNEHIRLLGNDDADRPYISVYNRVAGADDRQGYFGFPFADDADADIYLVADSGNLRLVSNGAGIILDADDGEVKDGNDHQFLRVDNGRANEQLIQYRVTGGTTDGSGLFSVTFPEAFGSSPVVTVTTRSTADRIAILNGTPSTTGFTVRYIDSSTGGALGSVTISLHWMACGFKSM